MRTWIIENLHRHVSCCFMNGNCWFCLCSCAAVVIRGPVRWRHHYKGGVSQMGINHSPTGKRQLQLWMVSSPICMSLKTVVLCRLCSEENSVGSEHSRTSAELPRQPFKKRPHSVFHYQQMSWWSALFLPLSWFYTQPFGSFQTFL